MPSQYVTTAYSCYSENYYKVRSEGGERERENKREDEKEGACKKQREGDRKREMRKCKEDLYFNKTLLARPYIEYIYKNIHLE